MMGKLARKRRNDHRERAFNMVIGTAFHVTLACSILETIGYLNSTYFRTAAGCFIWFSTACVWLLAAFMIFAGRKHLKASWNDKASLLDTGHGVRQAFTKLNILAYGSLATTLWIIYFIGKPYASLALGSSVAGILLIAFVLAEIGLIRAKRL